jgi:peptidoglycan/xylan/chitin deacetylase (PgdA/CDA1 family)
MRYLATVLFVLFFGHVSFAHAETNRVSVLLYHAVSLNSDRGNLSVVSLPRFERQMRFLAEDGYQTLSLAELVAFINGAPVPEKSIVITFDDGWKNQLHALPILKRYGFKAAFFIFPDGGIQSSKARYRSYMSWDEVRAISDDPDFEVQAHSMTHPYVKSSNLVTWVNGTTPGRSGADAAFELAESKALLERRLGVRIDYFAWPGSWYNKTLIDMAQRVGYRALFTAEGGVNRRGTDTNRVRRFIVDGACSLRVFKRSMREYRYFPCVPSTPPAQDASLQTAQAD